MAEVFDVLGTFVIMELNEGERGCIAEDLLVRIFRSRSKNMWIGLDNWKGICAFIIS